jgi:dTDP-4-amino-4,6-dideoxygalactose transaminase
MEEFVIKTEGAWHQEVHKFGLNYRLPDILCALGISQISRIEVFKSSRSKLFKKYTESLQNLKNLQLPTTRKYVDPMWHLFPIKVDVDNRQQIFEKLRKSGVGVQVNYIPAHWHPVFNLSPELQDTFPVSNQFYRSEISLPLHTEISEQEFDFIVNNLRMALA